MQEAPLPARAPAPPGAPTAPVLGATTLQGGTPIPIQVPLTKREVEALVARRNELSNQLQNAASRRRSLARELDRTSAASPARVGIEQRIQVLDNRLVQLETDLAATGQALSSAPAQLLATTEAPRMFGVLTPDQTTGVSITFILAVLMPLAIAQGVRILRRTPRTSTVRAEPSPELTQRLERVEQGVDAVAIEIERISEGQRFLTRILTEGNGAAGRALGAGAAEPIRVPERDKVRVGSEDRGP